MFRFDVFLEANRFIIECRTIETANETGILKYQFLLLLFASQIGECVDNYTENQIQNNNDNNEEEEQIVDDTCSEKTLLKVERKGKRY